MQTKLTSGILFRIDATDSICIGQEAVVKFSNHLVQDVQTPGDIGTEKKDFLSFSDFTDNKKDLCV